MGLGTVNFEEELADHLEIVPDPQFPLRMVLTPAEIAMHDEHGDGAAAFVEGLSGRDNDKLRFHGIKMWLDGSYQAMSLRVNFPGYLDGGNGLRGDVAWDSLADRMLPYWERGIQIHAHANGDEAIDAALDTLAELQRRSPKFDHRFTLEHYLISSPDQARRLAALGGTASVLIYYLHHRSELQNLQGLGPDRAEATGRLGSLERDGVTFGLHSDYAFALLPISPLTAVWIAVTRLGRDGKTVLAPGERISLARAMRAITIDAAYLLNMERAVGSIEVGKFADFTVLAEDPFAVDIDKLKDIPIWGTVLGGVKQPV
jgi:predicted amidohydrolase YtcJ